MAGAARTVQKGAMTDKARTLAFLLIASAAGMSLWFMTSAILPDIAAELGLPRARQTALSSAVQAGFVAGALVISVTGLADRLDPRWLFAACAFSTALANAALLVVPLDGSFAVALRFLTGALMAGVYPVGMKIAVGWGAADRGLLVGAVVGALAMGKSIPYGLAWAGGADWRLALGLGSVVAALGAGLVLFTRLGPHHRAASGFRPGAIRLALTDRRIRAAFLGYFGHMWELYIFWAWIGAAATASYLAAGAADPASLGKLTAFLAIAAGAPACVLAGRLADRIGKARVASGAMVASGGLALMTASSFGGPPEARRGHEREAAARHHRTRCDPRLADAVGEAAGENAGRCARGDGEEGRELAEARGVRGPRGEVRGGRRSADPGPEDVELPHVPEISEKGRTDAPVGQGEANGPGAEAGGRPVVRPETREEDKPRAKGRDDRAEAEGQPPVRPAGPGKAVGNRLAHRQRAHHRADEKPPVRGAPADGDLHAHRVDPRHERAGQEAERHREASVERDDEESGVGEGR